MAADYTIVSQESVSEFVPPNRVRERHEIWARADKSGAMVTDRVAAADYVPSHIKLIFGTLAEYANTLAAKPGVTAANMIQDVDATGNVVTKWQIQVESSSGDSTQTLVLAYGEGFDSRGYKKIADARANLDAIEQGT